MPQITIGSNTYNVLADQTDASKYFGGRVSGAKWVALADGVQKAALVDATYTLMQRTWQGAPVTPGQALPFPRTGLVDRDQNAVSSSTIPQDIINGACELALVLATNEKSVKDNAQGTAGNISSVSAVAGTNVAFFRPTPGTRLPTKVDDWIAPYLDGDGTGIGPRVGGATSSGTDECSQLDGLSTRYQVH